MVSADVRLRDTRRAFDGVAGDYDGPVGNNLLIQRMRDEMWRTLTATFPAGSRLLDLGCGTGIDAAYLAARGFSVLATDWSPAMVERTRSRLRDHNLEARASARVLGIHELDQLRGEQFDGIYSDLGPLNCVTDLARTARDCAALLRPGSRIVVSVMGRICPWEIAYYAVHGNWDRAFLRWRADTVAVPLEGGTVWTQYYTPRRFYQPFADTFALSVYRGLRILSPPPYMVQIDRRIRPICAIGEWLDRRIGALPGMRDTGDHFLMVLTRRP